MPMTDQERLDAVRARRDELLAGGVEGYAVGSRNLRYALDHLQEEEQRLENKIARAAGGDGRGLAVFRRPS